MPHYYEWATELPLDEVRQTLAALARKELHPSEAKRTLAWTITKELRSAAEADDAQREFDRVHREREAPEKIPTRYVTVDGAKEIAIVDLLVMAKLRPSKGDARRTVEQGGVRVDGEVATPKTMVPVKGEPLISVGKRTFVRIRFR
jgi:tyrosyl-tRNA synthetase